MARLENVDLSNSVNAWRMKTNLTASYVGDLDDLNTTDSGSIVGAINSIQSKFVVNGEVQGLARTALALSTGGSGTYSSLSYVDSAGIGGGVFTFTCNPLTPNDIPNLDAGKLTTGTINPSLIPAIDAGVITTGTLATARLPYLSANQTTAGQFDSDRIPSLHASKINRGTFLIGRIPDIPSSKVVSDGTTIPLAAMDPSLVRNNLSTSYTGTRVYNGTSTFYNTVTVGTSALPVTSTFNGQINHGAHIIPDTDNSYSVGSSSFKYANMYATTFHGNATSANFADLAEKYTTDEDYPIGTVMMVNFDTNGETTKCGTSGIPVGVISAEPAFLMNAEAEGQALALKGRVPVRVCGQIRKGEAVYTWKNGCGSTEFNGAHMIGISLETSDIEDEKMIECVLKL